MPTHRLKSARLTPVAIAAASVLSLASCVRTVVKDGLDTATAVNATEDEAAIAELDFLNRLAERSVVTNAEGLFAMVLYVEAQQREHEAEGNNSTAISEQIRVRPTATYDERVAEGKRLKWLDANWNEPGDQAMQRGTLARAIAVAYEIKGGVMMRLVGPTARYSSRELAYLGILSPGSEQQTMTGTELISILSKAQDYQVLEQVRAEQDRAKK